MIERVIGFFHRQFLLAEDTRRHQQDIKELRQEVRSLERSVEKLAAEIILIKATEKLEREKLMLLMQNIASEINHRLPPKN